MDRGRFLVVDFGPLIEGMTGCWKKRDGDFELPAFGNLPRQDGTCNLKLFNVTLLLQEPTFRRVNTLSKF